MLAPMSDESRQWWRKLGRSALSKLVLSTAAAIGTKIGEHIVDALVGRDDDSENEAGSPGETS
jgi:hypothetical protein